MKIIAIIPARYASSRFPGKPLALIRGKTMIEYVYNRVKDIKDIDDVIVATDDKRIFQKVTGIGGKAVMTSSNLQSGTDRIAEVAAGLEADIVVNVQGDEPLLKAEMVSEAIQPFYSDSSLVMSTLKKEISDIEEIENPNVVKVVTDKNGYALFFSRCPLPYPRKKGTVYYKHIGLYVYNKDFLLEFSKLAQTPAEKSESLEQLRALENGYKIRVIETAYDSVGVDTPEDIIRVEKMMDEEESMA